MHLIRMTVYMGAGIIKKNGEVCVLGLGIIRKRWRVRVWGGHYQENMKGRHWYESVCIPSH